jgi:hypothetical protein
LIPSRRVFIAEAPLCICSGSTTRRSRFGMTGLIGG